MNSFEWYCGITSRKTFKIGVTIPSFECFGASESDVIVNFKT